jgi:ArsR family transcriptional regulator
MLTVVASLKRGALEQGAVERAAAMIRVLGHPLRLRIVECLEGGERCVYELVESLGEPQAVVSQQLARMRAAGIVRCRREGPHVWYAVADQRAVRMLECLRRSR